MAQKFNPLSGNFDLVLSPGSGTATTSFASDSGTATPTAAGVITIAGGTALNTTGAANTITINSTGGGIEWNEETGTSVSMSVNNGYITNNAALVTATLPTTASVGDMVRVSGKGAGGWRIAQNASEIIHFGTSTTTTGVGGRLDSTETNDAVEIICIVADTEWMVISSIGNITVT